MADLEDMGFVSSPTRRAGRVPTPRGYRLFVDSLLTVQPLEQQQTDLMQGQLQVADPSRAIQNAAQLLSRLSQFAGVVLTPRRTSAFRQVEFVRLSDRRVLLIIVTPEGDVQNRVLMTEAPYTPSQLVEAANILNEQFAGRSFGEVRERLHGDLRILREDISRLMESALQAGSQAAEESEPLVISGERNLLGVSDLATDMDKLRRHVRPLRPPQPADATARHGDQRARRADLHRRGVDARAGRRHEHVVAPYTVDGKVIGTLGVIGPTRMAYERVIPIVDITAKLLSNVLSQSQ